MSYICGIGGEHGGISRAEKAVHEGIRGGPKNSAYLSRIRRRCELHTKEARELPSDDNSNLNEI